MPKIAKPFNEAAAKVADEEFYRKHPDRKLKPLRPLPAMVICVTNGSNCTNVTEARSSRGYP